jgi:hypothetical protein
VAQTIRATLRFEYLIVPLLPLLSRHSMWDLLRHTEICRPTVTVGSVALLRWMPLNQAVRVYRKLLISSLSAR